MASNRPTSKRHISFYNKAYASVCSGINLKSQCTNTDCESVRSKGGLVVIKCPDLDTCIYQDVVYNLPCPSCGTILNPQQFSGVIFVRCEAKISFADQSELLQASQEETVLWKMEYLGPEVRMEILERESEGTPSLPDISQNYMSPTDGVNLLATCHYSDCLAFKNNKGHVVARVGMIESAVFQELVKFRNCPGCNRELDARSFNAVTFLGCRAQVEISGKVETFDATSLPKHFKMETSGPQAVIRVNPDPASGGLALPMKEPTLGNLGLGNLPDGPLKEGFENFLRNLDSANELTFGDLGLGSLALGDFTPGDFKEGFKKLLQKEGNGKSFVHVCPGLNIQAVCINPKCDATSVVIQCPEIQECLYYDLISTLKCPSCSCTIPPVFFVGITLVKCRAVVTIGSKYQTVKAAGGETKDFTLQLGGPPVSINILSREKDPPSSERKAINPPSSEKKAINPPSSDRKNSNPPSSDRKYTKACDGVNFEAFCENPDCLSVKEYHGFVTVKRDEQFIQRGGFLPNRCNYSTEVQNLKCPSCSARLNPKSARGVALVRCKGMIQIAGTSQNFEAKMNDFVKFHLDYSDPQNFVEYEVVNALPHGRGLNVVCTCSNKYCPGQNIPLLKDVVFIQFGFVTGFKVNEVMLAKKCPACQQKIPMSNIVSVLFNGCTAVVRINGKVTNYLTGSNRIQTVQFEFRDNIEVDILPVIAGDVSLKLFDNNPFFSLTTGLNVQAICSNQGCKAKRMHKGRVCISSPQTKNSKLSELLPTLSCPSCSTPLSELSLVCLSFVQCKALLQTPETKYLIEAAPDEVIDFERSFLNSELSIQVFSLDEDFPESKESIKKGSGFSHDSICHGLNFLVSCPNPTCVTVQNHEYVNIMSGHLLDFDYRLAVHSLTCPCCATPIPPGEVQGVTMLCSTGEVQIGDRVVKFDYSGEKISRITIPNDGSNVWFKVKHRTYDLITQPAIAHLHGQFRTVCKGLNFRCYCKNPLCNTFQLREGLVVVQRDPAFINAHGYAHNVCNYREEISKLRCPDCTKPLQSYFVWGVTFVSCNGTIIRNGSPPEKFSTPSDKVILYALDRDDTSVRIEMSM